MFKLSPEESAELWEGGFECSDIGTKEICELYSKNQIFLKLFVSTLMLTSPDPPHPESLVTVQLMLKLKNHKAEAVL